jgi:hypothetical protein
MKSLKSDALEMISKLPDDVMIDDIMYQVYVLDEIRKGLDDLEHGNTISSEDLKADIKEW